MFLYIQYLRMQHVHLNKYKSITQCWGNSGPTSQTVAQHYASIGSLYHICWGVSMVTHCIKLHHTSIGAPFLLGGGSSVHLVCPSQLMGHHTKLQTISDPQADVNFSTCNSPVSMTYYYNTSPLITSDRCVGH